MLLPHVWISDHLLTWLNSEKSHNDSQDISNINQKLLWNEKPCKLCWLKVNKVLKCLYNLMAVDVSYASEANTLL